MAAGFLHLPVELRLEIYELFLAAHQRVLRDSQPSNSHLRLLRTCSLIAAEAGPLLRRYVSLLHEHQIAAFLIRAPLEQVARIEWADVANDGRVLLQSHPGKGTTNASTVSTFDQADAPHPLSNLHLALARMTALRRLRVFQPRQGLPINLQSTMKLHRSRKLAAKFERAMFPKHGAAPGLSYYELYLTPETRVDLFDAIRPDCAVALRLSGEIVPSDEPEMNRRRVKAPVEVVNPAQDELQPLQMTALRHVVLAGIRGTYFDRHTVEEAFPGAALESFAYVLGTRLSFELRDSHLSSLAASHGTTLRRLVLLGCSRLTSTAIADALASMPCLEQFALHMITVDELRTNFMHSLLPSLNVLQLQISNAKWAVPLKHEERGLCEAIETLVLLRDRVMHRVSVCFRQQIMDENDRRSRWIRIAHQRKIAFQIGPWESDIAEGL